MHYIQNNKVIKTFKYRYGISLKKDTYETALFKANELDEHLGFKCEIHRHSEGFESDLLCSFFPTLTF